MQKVTISFVTFVFALGLRFRSSRPVEQTIQPQTQIERQLQDAKLTQAYQAMEGSESLSVRNLFKISGGDLGKASSPGARARSDARNAMNTKGAKSKPAGSVFAQAWVQNPSNRARPAAANRLAQQFQPGPWSLVKLKVAMDFFGRFSPRTTTDPSNTGYAGGPRSITVLEGQSKNQDGQASSEKQPNTRTFKAHDGFKAELTDK
nr:hypothetical protein [Naviculales sp.]